MNQKEQTTYDQLSFDADYVMRILENKRLEDKKESIDSFAAKLGLSTSSYKRYLAGDTAPLAKMLETAFRICLYSDLMLFQLAKQAPSHEREHLLFLINRLVRLSPTNQRLVEQFIEAVTNQDPQQNTVIFSEKDFLEAIHVIGTRYYKILKVDLKAGTYCPVYVKNDEWSLLPEEKTFKLQDWLDFFLQNKLIHPDDIDHFTENANLYALKTVMRFTDYDSHIHYRRLVNDSYKPVCMEILKCYDYSSSHQTIFMCIRDDF